MKASEVQVGKEYLYKGQGLHCIVRVLRFTSPDHSCVRGEIIEIKWQYPRLNVPGQKMEFYVRWFEEVSNV